MMKTNSFIGAKGTSVQQWENENSGVSYPFKDDSGCDAVILDSIVDACISIPSSVGGDPFLSCFHIGPSFVSAMVTVDRSPALYASVSKERFNPFSPVVMESSVAGVSGMLTFGGIRFDKTVTIRGRYRFSESSVVRPDLGRLSLFRDPETNETAKGYVGFEVPEGVSLSLSEAGHVSTVSFSTNDDIKNSVLVPCAKYERSNYSPEPIMSINGVRPDDKGRIAIVFTKN